MYSRISDILRQAGLGDQFLDITAYMICLAVILVICIVIKIFVKYPIVRFLLKITKNKKVSWAQILNKYKFFNRLANLAFPVVIYLFMSGIDFEDHPVFWNTAVSILLILIVISIINSFIKSANEIYTSY